VPFRRGKLIAANVDSGWAAGGWRTWEAPRNVVVGESFKQDALRRLTGHARENGYLIPVDADLVREPENEYDTNAVRVEVNGELVGYLRRGVAAKVARPADHVRLTRFTLCGLIRGGAIDAPEVGVHLWLERRRSEGVRVPDSDAYPISWPPYDGEGLEA
jgi:hypothetical protein